MQQHMLVAISLIVYHHIIVAKTINTNRILLSIKIWQFRSLKCNCVVFYFRFCENNIVTIHFILYLRHLHRIVYIYSTLCCNKVLVTELFTLTNNGINQIFNKLNFIQTNTPHHRLIVRDMRIQAFARCAHIHQQF